ncbi:MAG TPA: DUF2889 domain-containing protein [bacterium]
MRDIFERNINIKLIPLDSEHAILEASLLDLSHSMHVSLKVNAATQKIVEATAKMMRVPFTVCTLAEKNLKNLIGLKIERGINKQIASIVGRENGCTHLVEILQSAIRFGAAMLIARAAGYESLGKSEKLTEEERIERSISVLKNTCVVFKSSD